MTLRRATLRLPLAIIALAGAWLAAAIGPSSAQRPGAPAAGSAAPEHDEEYVSLWERGEYAKALISLEEQIDRLRRTPLRWALDHAELKFQLGDVDAAIAGMENILRQVPQDPEYVVRLARYYKARGRVEDAKRTLEQTRDQVQRYKSTWMSPNNTLAYAQILEQLGEDPKKLLSSVYSRLLEDYPDFPAGFVGAGDLAFGKADYQLALQYYQDALKKDEHFMPALEGMAECYWKSSDPRLDETLNLIDNANPRNPRASAIRVQRLLDAGKAQEALDLAEMALSINNRDAKFIAFKGAALFLLGKESVAAEVQHAALKFNPVCSEVYRTAGAVASRHYRFKEGAEFQRKALEVDPEDHLAKANLALDLLRLGDEAEGRKLLEAAFADDKYNVQLFNMAKLMDTLDGYATIARGPFILKVPKKEQAIIADDALGLLQEAFDRYEKRYKVKLEQPILVQIFDSHDDFMVRSVGLPGAVGYMGICFGKLITMDSPSARPKHAMNWRSVLWHEFVHVVTLQKTKNRMPRWLSEGISVYEETQRSPAWGQRMDMDYKALIAEEPLPGLSDLETYFAGGKTPNHLMFGYFASSEFVRFYVETYGMDALLAALDLMAEQGDSASLLAAACGKSMETVDDGFRAYLEKRLKAFENIPTVEKKKGPMALFAGRDPNATRESSGLARASSPFTEAMDAADEAIRKKDWGEAERLLKTAHRLFPDYIAADSPLRKLIDVYGKKGDRKALKKALRDEIDWVQNDFSACEELVKILAEEKDWDEVAKLAHWSLGIDPFDVGMRQALLDGLQNGGKDKESLDVLDQLATLDAPRAVDYKLRRAETLIRLKEWDAAKWETVALLEATPHFWKAQDLLLRIVESRPGEGSDAGGN